MERVSWEARAAEVTKGGEHMNSRFIVGVLVLIVGVAIGWYVLGRGRTGLEFPKKDTTVSGTTGTSGALIPGTGEGALGGGEKGGVQERTVVTYTGNGFAPNPVTVRVGAIVTFVNESTGGMWVASDVHPTHQILPGFDQLTSVQKGGMYEYTFDKVGTWRYHNHTNPQDAGSVVVTK